MTPRWHDSDAAAQYVAGTFDPDALDAFEEHLLACDECRREVRLGAAIRAAGSTGPTRVRRADAARRRGRIIVPIAAAAAIAIAFGVRAPRSDGLGAVDAAPFVAGPARAGGDPVAALVDSGMAAYGAQEYPRAALLLGRASASDSSAGVQFYLGVSQLLSRHDAAALTALLRALEPAGNPFADDARYYAMKALVRQRLRDSASALARAAPGTATPTARFRVFADSLSRP